MSSPHRSGQDSNWNNNSPETNIQKQCFRTKMCTFFNDGNCNKGDSCSFAHDKEQLKDKPDFKKTRLCVAFNQRKCMKTADECHFAHGEMDLRKPRLNVIDEPKPNLKASPAPMPITPEIVDDESILSEIGSPSNSVKLDDEQSRNQLDEHVRLTFDASVTDDGQLKRGPNRQPAGSFHSSHTTNYFQRRSFLTTASHPANGYGAYTSQLLPESGPVGHAHVPQYPSAMYSPRKSFRNGFINSHASGALSTDFTQASGTLFPEDPMVATFNDGSLYTASPVPHPNQMMSNAPVVTPQLRYYPQGHQNPNIFQSGDSSLFDAGGMTFHGPNNEPSPRRSFIGGPIDGWNESFMSPSIDGLCAMTSPTFPGHNDVHHYHQPNIAHSMDPQYQSPVGRNRVDAATPNSLYSMLNTPGNAVHASSRSGTMKQQ